MMSSDHRATTQAIVGSSQRGERKGGSGFILSHALGVIGGSQGSGGP